ncbi:1-phosphofructokinase [Mediterraneibacter massiliensis]|uniref:1-phosphofructokinase n=1 Tax=Mediterraneibacter massiliensis TaxID=1720300 RepID=UPI0022E953D6|nr:1-phosphofructokinase [Mediterraneibacter massiliensis]
MNKKIVTVTLNPCVDLTLTVDKFLYGGTNNVVGTRKDISGKGINTSVVLKNLGIENIATGLMFLEDKDILRDFLEKNKIPNKFILAPGNMRTNIKIFDNSQKSMSEFNGKGCYVDTETQNAFFAMMEEVLAETKILIVSGSVPPGISIEIYKWLTAMAVEKGIRVIADASGQILEETVESKPFLIKPNTDELEKTFHMPSSTEEEIVQAANKIIKKGVKYVCVSRGEKGAVLVTEKKIYTADGVAVKVKGIQGAGDSMIAGFCYAMEHAMEEKDYLKYAVAAATGSLLHEGTKLCEKEDILEVADLVQVNEKSNEGGIK